MDPMHAYLEGVARVEHPVVLEILQCSKRLVAK